MATNGCSGTKERASSKDDEVEIVKSFHASMARDRRMAWKGLQSCPVYRDLKNHDQQRLIKAVIDLFDNRYSTVIGEKTENTCHECCDWIWKGYSTRQFKITVWNTGAQGGEGSAADASAPLRNIFQSLPPLLSTINEQTGIAPPSWMAQMPNQGQAVSTGKGPQVNGHQ